MKRIFCYKVGVSDNFEKKEAALAMKVGPSAKRRIEEIAAEHDRTSSYVARELMIRGLAMYEIDGQLKGGVPKSEHSANVSLKTRKVPVLKEPAK